MCDHCRSLIQNQIKIKTHHPQDFHHLDGAFLLDRVITFWEYTREMETCVHLVKYQSRKKLGGFIAQFLNESIQNLCFPLPDYIIPVPLHPRRFRERGFNQSVIYAKVISRMTGAALNLRWLRRFRYTQTQTCLSAEERQFNVRDAFFVKNPVRLEDKRIWLVDDVITSGATVNSCARALREAGACSVIGMGLSRPQLYEPAISP